MQLSGRKPIVFILSSLTIGDPKTATAEKGRKIVQATVDRIKKFIESWNHATGKR